MWCHFKYLSWTENKPTDVYVFAIFLSWSMVPILAAFAQGFKKSGLFYVNLIVHPRNVHGKCSLQNVHSKPIVNPRTHCEYPQEGGRLDAKRH